jgi:hypothetical protein
MKLKNIIFTLVAPFILAFSTKAIAQTDTAVKRYYAYASFFSADMQTEYISSVFCWVYKAPQNPQTYPPDFLMAWCKSNFKDHLPKVKPNGYICRFQLEGGGYFTAEEAVKYWNEEIKESTNQSIDVVIVTFPTCIDN